MDELMRIEGLKKYFPSGRKDHPVRAVDGVSLSINAGETLGIVGESGCGKTTFGKLIMRSVDADEGAITFESRDILKMSKKELRSFRTNVQMVFQDPYSSLNPRMTVRRILEEPLICLRGDMNAQQRTQRVNELLELVGLDTDYADRYPHEFSGGQRQRICIARALAPQPRLIVLDEAVSALDVSVQSQVLNLLRDLQRRLNLTYIFISHNLSVIRHISDRVGVMYLGRIVELGESESLFDAPAHPYTEALLSAIPVPDPEKSSRQILLRGELPDPTDVPHGCPFEARCFDAGRCAECKNSMPQLVEISPGHFTACPVRSAVFRTK